MRLYTKLYATYGGRLGPAPSWTHVAAVVKYPLYPLGLDESTLQNTIVAKPRDALRGVWDAPLSGEAAPCRLVARGVGRFAACKGSAAEFVSPISMRHRLPFAHYAAPYAAVLACKSAEECSEFCDQAGLCTA